MDSTTKLKDTVSYVLAHSPSTQIGADQIENFCFDHFALEVDWTTVSLRQRKNFVL